MGQNFYFIYSGSVFVNVEDVNAQGEKFVKTEVVLSKGDAFGVSQSKDCPGFTMLTTTT